MLSFRLYIAMSYLTPQLMEVVPWLLRSKEYWNFTTDLTERNETYLASFVSAVTQERLDSIKGYIRELKSNAELRDHIAKRTAASRFRHVTDAQPRYGCRLGWYAFVRAKKPKVVVETGVDKGFGTCVIAEALRKNAEEGHPGIVYGLDIDTEAGFLFTEPYSLYGRIVYGSSLETLKTLPPGVDIILHDSDHRPEYEMAEYEAVKDKLSRDALILSDNSHYTTTLCEFAERTGRRFLFFAGEPKDHWYRGIGIGAAYENNGRDR